LAERNSRLAHSDCRTWLDPERLSHNGSAAALGAGAMGAVAIMNSEVVIPKIGRGSHVEGFSLDIARAF
jgi:hypothetical protein